MNPPRACGFTLVELLVAVAVMALLGLMSWRAIDNMAQTQAITRERGAALSTLQAALGQWVADLDAVQEDDELNAIDYDGRVLRLIRRDAQDGEHQSAGLRVVAWTRQAQSGQWSRWQSPALQRRAQLLQAWQQAATWAEGAREPLAGEVRLMAVSGWELFYFRGDSWSHPLSATGSTSGPSLPDGVRVVLNLPATSVLPGRLQRDWVRPAVSRSRS